MERLFLLPFDHRHSFVELLGAEEPLTLKQVKQIKEYKQIIYTAFKKAIVSKDNAGILVDDLYGKEILLDAHRKGFITCYTLEKSGQQEFKLEHADYKNRLKKFKPTFAKILIRYNSDKAVNKKQAKNIVLVHKELKKLGIKLLLEVLVKQSLTLQAIKELQAAGVRPDIWKLAGMNSLKDWQRVAQTVNSKARIIMLGGGDSKQKVEQSLKIAAKIPEVIGFAIGRTIFQEPLLNYQNKKITKPRAIDAIKNNYLQFIHLFERAHEK